MINEETKKNVAMKLKEYFSKLQDVFHLSDSEMVQTLLGSAIDLGFEREVYLRERDEARAWAIYYRAQFNAAMAEIEQRNQAAYFATVDNPPPFSPVMEED